MSAGKARAWAIGERRAEVARLLRKGWTERRIADHLGIPKSTAHEDAAFVAAELVANRVSDAEQCRALATERLAVVRSAAASIMSAARGTDPELALKAADRIVKVEERTAKMYGLDAATEVLVTQRLESELAAVVEALRGALDDAAFTKALAALGVSSAEGAGEPAEDSDATGRPDPVP